MKKKMIRLGIVFLGVVALVISLVKVCGRDKLDTYLAIGDYLSVSGSLKEEKITSFVSLLGEYFLEEREVKEINDNYTSSKIDSTLLLKMISEGASSGKDEGLKSLIENSKYITISVGMNDILDYIRFDSNNQKIVYDKEYIKRKLEIMKQNYFDIVEEIKNINGDARVYLMGYYCPFFWVDEEYKIDVNEVFLLLNDCIKDVGVLTDVNYVDISDVASAGNMIDDYQIYLNDEGQKHIFELIKKDICID